MKRFSDRNQLSTLSELNVTPLLDLAFVLLIIFMITTPLMESSNDLVLPKSRADKTMFHPTTTISIHRGGEIRMDHETVADLDARLNALRRGGPEVAVAVRADRELPVQALVDVMDRIKAAGITRVRLLSTEARTP